MADNSIGNNSEIFDPTKEKKKKKKKMLDLDSVLQGSSSAVVPPPEPTDESGDAQGQAGSVGGDGDGAGGDLGSAQHDDILESLESFGSKKKKKKVKKVVDDDIIAELVEGGAGGEEDALELVFDKTKKKKKKPAALDELVAKGDNEEVAGVEQTQPQEVVVVVVDVDAPPEDQVVSEEEHPLTQQQSCSDELGDSLAIGEDDEGSDTDIGITTPVPAVSQKSWLNSDRDYTYDELLTRVFEIMRAKNPEMVSGTKQKFVMRPPQVVRIGTKKTSFVNFMEICKMLHRHQKHLLDFLLSELGTSGSIDGNNQLIIKGRFQQKQIENVLRRYIKEYVTCHTCKSPNTLLQKDFRLFFLQCEACGSRCSVASIKHGFQAVTGKRAAMRAKAN